MGPVLAVCTICEEGGFELYCTTCDPVGAPYHEVCWGQQPLHRPHRTPTHRRVHARDIERLHFVNEPNRHNCLDEGAVEMDTQNCFVEFDLRSHKFQFGPRAFPLLRHGPGHHVTQYPSFISFIGPTASGKSFLLRALQHGSPNGFPSPIPGPGAQERNHRSTSSDINLYADWQSVNSESPILFLDCEGFEGSVPVGLAAKAKKMVSHAAAHLGVRRRYVDNAYPRFVYAFSSCIIFVTSGSLAESTKIGERLLSYATQGASGLRNQGFKPSLFVVFNRFEGGTTPNFNWSIESSTTAFLAHENLGDLKLYYESINVIYIPSATHIRSDTTLAQIDVFHRHLREEHHRAFSRRRDFRLIFPPETLSHFLWRALGLFSKDRLTVFNWSIEAVRFGLGEIDTRTRDLWIQCTRYATALEMSAHETYEHTRKIFEQHILFCALLSLTRTPPYGERVGVVPCSLETLIKQVERLALDFSLCAALSSGTRCEESKNSHGDHHQCQLPSGAHRWPGQFEGEVTQTFRSMLKEVLQTGDAPNVSLRTFGQPLVDPNGTSLPSEICSLRSCFGCLKAVPVTILSCRHAFCLDCVRDLEERHTQPHEIWCPFHKSSQRFAPRLLPHRAGYRILSLDGGGVKGIAQLVILKHIEEKCFDIPIAQLFDLIVGTSVGGQIALALTTETRIEPFTLPNLIANFKAMSKKVFVHKHPFIFRITGIPWFLGKTTYSTKVFESQFQELFGNDYNKLVRVATSLNNVPHVAVTTVSQNSFKVKLVANYNREPTPGAYTLLLDSDPNACMPVWAAARCTSAALPYFKAFVWQGELLLDGGMLMNCPAKAAFSEGRRIWPGQSCDTLVSLGTGTSAPQTTSTLWNQTSQVFDQFLSASTNSDDAWEEFDATLPPEDCRFRLNPVNEGPAFKFDDVDKLDEIEEQAGTWLLDCPEVIEVCKKLIASLFFFVFTPVNDNILNGTIRCRLSIDLAARRHLFEAMLKDSDTHLFMVDFVERNMPPTYIHAIESLRDALPDSELSIPVQLHGFPEEGEVAVQIKMRSLEQNGSDKKNWTHISGSPCTVWKRL